MGIVDDVKDLEDMYNEAIEENDKWRTEKKEYGKTFGRLTTENKDLEEKLKHAREANCMWMQKEIEYGETIRRLTIELNDTKKDRNNIERTLITVQRREDKLREENSTLQKTKKSLESMLDLCESSCSACGKLENLTIRVANLKTRLADREDIIKFRDSEINGLVSKLDLCNPTCPACKKHIEVENLKDRIDNLESSLKGSFEVREELQERKAYWHDRYVSHVAYCLKTCPRVPPK